MKINKTYREICKSLSKVEVIEFRDARKVIRLREITGHKVAISATFYPKWYFASARRRSCL
ncbi:MAG: hypothetical protein PHD61_03245 [Bacteroidales bacterium]|nr:hypothetical protein [Bacteroidales bacterium]